VNYCINMAVGYASVTFLLWNLIVLTLTAKYSITTLLTFLSFSPILALGVFLLGALLNCTFERIGEYFSLEPSLGISVGWILIGLTIALASMLTAPPPPTWDGLLKAVYQVGSESMSNSFLSSDIFYRIGNVTLSLFGIR